MEYSVIIPVKNNPGQLSRCLDSIPERDDIEVLVCDDCSSEEQINQIKTLCDKRSQTRLFESDSSRGAGYARNVGISNSKGDWLIFSDSDDFFDKDFWNKIDNIINQTDSDIVYFLVQGVYSDNLKPAERGTNYRNQVEGFVDGKKNGEERLRFYHMVPWGKVFRRSFIEDKQIRFDEIRASNDVMFNIKAGSLAKTIEAHKIIMYYVTVSSNSLTKKKDKELLRCRFDVLIRHYKYVKSLG